MTEELKFTKGEHCIYLGDNREDSKAFITFTSPTDGVTVIDHTIVDPSMGGQGIAGQLVDEVVNMARQEGLKLDATCSYAKAKLEKKEEYHDVYVRTK